MKRLKVFKRTSADSSGNFLQAAFLCWRPAPILVFILLVVLAFFMAMDSVSLIELTPLASGWMYVEGSRQPKWYKELGDHHKCRNQTTKPAGQKKVLILAAPRTGSSFLGALLSSYPNSTFIYEPLYALSTTPMDIKKPNVGLSLMDELFNCCQKGLEFISNIEMVTKGSEINPETCTSSGHLFIKTIRLRLEFAGQWLSSRKDIRVVHLVRDPRGQLASLSRTTWPNRSPKEQCSLILSDVRLAAQLLDKEGYMRIKYEDLVDPATRTNVLRNVASFLGLPAETPPQVEDFLRLSRTAELHPTDPTHALVNGKPGWNNRINHFESVFRSSDFSPNASWRKKAEEDPLWIAEVEQICDELMVELGYPSHTNIR